MKSKSSANRLKKLKAASDAAIVYVRGNKRFVIERMLFVVFLLCGAIALKHCLWPYRWAIAGACYVAITKTSSQIIAIVALYVAWSNYRRGNSAIVKLILVRYQQVGTAGVNNGQMYPVFEVLIKVLGIPLRNPSMGIRGVVGSMQMNMPLPQLQDEKPVPSGGTLEKGMIASYGLRACDLHPSYATMLFALSIPTTTNLTINVYSNGYLVKRFRLQYHPMLRTVVRWWNKWATQININYISLPRTKRGRKYIKERKLIPSFSDPMLSFQTFVNAAKFPQGGTV